MMLALGLALLAMPFLFGVARLVTTASDARYLAVALASTLGATLIIRGRNPRGARARFLIGVATAVLLSALTGVALGARSPTSIGVVAIAFALCSVTGASLVMRARRQSSVVG